MKKISVLIFIVLSFIVFNLGTEVKAKEGIGQVGKSALVCAYCVSNNDCYYVIQDVNEEPNDDPNIDDEYQRIFKNTFSNEIELQNGGIIFDKNFYISILPTTTKCYNYMHYIHGGSDKAGENSSYDYYYYAFDDDQYIDVESDKYKSNIKGLYDFYIQSDGIINYEFVYQYGLDSYGKDEDEIDNDKIVEELKNIISSNKLIIDNKYNNSNNSGDVDEWDGDIDEGCSVDHSSDLACGSLYFIPKEIPFFTNLIMNLIKIITPIVLVIKGSIDLIKAMTGGNEQEISKSRAKFFKRLIPAILVFLIILVVQFIFGLFATDSENNTFLACSNCFLNNKCSNTPQSKIDEYCSDNGQGEVVNPDGYKPGDNGNQGGTSNPGGNTTISNKNLRDKIATFALNVALRSSNEFIYLEPAERDSNALKNISNLGSVTGGNCLSKTYNGEKCIIYNTQTYYGTDCNGFVSYVYHKSANFEASKFKFFAPDTFSRKWDLVDNAGNYFTRYSSTFSGNDAGLEELKKVVQKGDAIGRICKKPDGTYSTHIGIYVGGTVNNIVDNAGWINSKEQRIQPIKNRTLKEFVGTYTDCTLTLFQLK